MEPEVSPGRQSRRFRTLKLSELNGSLGFDTLLAKKNDQSTGLEASAEVITSLDALGGEQDGAVFEGSSVTEHIVFADLSLDLTVEQAAEVNGHSFRRPRASGSSVC